MPSIGLNLRVTTDSKQGGRLYMEDVLRVGFEKGLDGKEVEFGYFAVFDGHGGVEAAQFAREHLLNEIRKSKGFWSDDDDQVLKAIKLAFINTHKLMWNAHMSWARTSSGYPSTSGTTSSVVVIRNQTLYVAHVGDSAVVLGTRGEDGRLLADCLTDEHKPNSPKEMMRIRESGGAVMAKAGVNRVVWQRPKKPQHGPIRRSTLVEKIPFLAVARSLGDLWSYNFQKDVFVVSPEPDVLSLKLDPNRHKCLVIASDGLWNVIKPQQSVDFIDELEHRSEYENTKEKPASMLVKLALRRWDSLFYRADNTSVIVVMIDPPGPSTAKMTRTPSVSTGSTVRLASESDAEDTSESDVTGSDCDIDLDDGDTDDLVMSCEVGEIFPRLCAGGGVSSGGEDGREQRGTTTKAMVSRSLTESCVRGLNRPAGVSTGQHPCFNNGRQGKLAKTGNRTKATQKDSATAVTTSATSQQATQTSLKASPTPNILMEAALNAPPFMEPATKVTSPLIRSPQKNPPLSLTGSGEAGSPNNDTTTSPSRTLRSRSPRQVGENLTNSGGTSVLSAPKSRFSLSPSSSFISNDLRSPLEATSARSPFKVDTASRSGALPLATVSPIWPSSLEVGSEVEVGELLGVTRLSGTMTTTSGQRTCQRAAGPTADVVGITTNRSDLAGSGSENVEHPRRGRPTCRQGQGVKRRASSSPASLTAKRPQTVLTHKPRTPQSQPNTRAHFKSPTKKAKV